MIRNTLIEPEPGSYEIPREVVAEAIERSDLPAYLLDSGSAGWPFGRAGRPTLGEVERLYIERVLEEVGGNQTRAAEILGISRKSLWERRRRFDLK